MSLDQWPRDFGILLAEDDGFLRRTFSQVLAGLNLKNISMAENGKEALSLINRDNIALLITDIQMPRMNGLELIRQIRLGNAACDRDMRIIVLTSFSTADVVSASLSLDVNGFLVKPISPANTAEKIGVALKEQVCLKEASVYQEIDTDLESIALASSARSDLVNASITGQEEWEGRRPSGRKVNLKHLEPGMRLSEHLRSKCGVVLVASGHELNESLINRINELEEVIETTYVAVH